jgi:hypothetical protein
MFAVQRAQIQVIRLCQNCETEVINLMFTDCDVLFLNFKVSGIFLTGEETKKMLFYIGAPLI